MNRRVLFGLTVSLCLTGGALAQTMPTTTPSFPPIPNSIKTSGTPAGFAAQISASIVPVIAALTDDTNPAGQTAAREWLIAQAGAGGTGNAFAATYAERLQAALLPVVTNAKSSVRTKIDAGIVAEKVSAVAGTTALQPTIEAVLADKNPAVALQGIKAAGKILAPVLAANAKQKLTSGIVALVRANPNGDLAGPMVEEAYNALIGVGLSNAAAVPGMANDLMDLAQWRADQYRTGFPNNPGLDAGASLVLINANSWKQLTADQQLRAMQLWVDLVALMAQRGAQAGQSGTDYFQGVRRSGNVLANFAGPNGVMPNPGVAAAAQSIANVPIGAVGSSVLMVAGPAALTAPNGAFAQLQAIGQFSKLDPPPALGLPPAASSVAPGAAPVGVGQ